MKEHNENYINTLYQNQYYDNQISGRWTQFQHQKFLYGLEIYGKNWKKISTILQSRTSTQIRSHAQKYFVKIKKNTHQSSQIQINNVSQEIIHYIPNISIDKQQKIINKQQNIINKQQYFINKQQHFINKQQHFINKEQNIINKRQQPQQFNIFHNLMEKKQQSKQSQEEITIFGLQQNDNSNLSYFMQKIIKNIYIHKSYGKQFNFWTSLIQQSKLSTKSASLIIIQNKCQQQHYKNVRSQDELQTGYKRIGEFDFEQGISEPIKRIRLE